MTDTDPPPDDPIPVPEIGDVLAETYVLRAELGVGGMGRVFDAHDRDLNRTVAIKVPFDRVGERQLLLEARALAVLEHRGVINVHALPEHGGVRFLVMEKIQGITLEDHLERRSDLGTNFATDEALDLLIEVAEALRHIHRSGLTHRDVKPSNIMLAAGRVVVMDLGVALPEFDSGKDQTIVGTPAYIAPELIGGSTKPGQGYLSDVYSLGILAFELCTGDLPYDGTAVLPMLLKHLESPVPDARAANPEVPTAVARLIRSMMSKSPSDRPADMEEVVWRLRELRKSLGSVGGERPILIVDDDEDMHALLEVFLSEWAPGVEVHGARSGEEALELITKVQPGLMLLDLQLPGMSGMEVSMHLQGTRIGDECPIIAMSGRARTDDISVWKGLGVTHFVSKGARFGAELEKVVRRWRSSQLTVGG